MGKTSIIAMLVIALGAVPALASADSYGGVNPASASAENLPPKVEEIPKGA